VSIPTQLVQLHPSDNVAIARQPLAANTALGSITTTSEIPAGHKVALIAFAPGDRILKYGQLIGLASQPIAPGDHIHSHNMAAPTQDGHTSHTNTTAETTQPINSVISTGAAKPRSGETPVFRDARTASAHVPTHFLGYLRPNGRVGTRNYIGILTTVNCSATVAKRIAAHFTPERLADFPNVSGVVALTHSTGCGMAGEGEAADVLRRTTAGYANHPNFAAVLLLGLGCEMNQVSSLVPLTDPATTRSTTIQAEGGTRAAIERGIAEIEAMLPAANAITRTPQPLSELIIGLQCGGSDAWSGVTANPALGLAMDMLIAAGGSAILSETSEIFGAEHLLTARSDREVAEALLARVEWWQAYTARHGQVLDNNPSPGNKAGGLTTILEKSLGAVAKAGSTPLREVLEYAQPVTQHGLIFMDSPGYDPVSATGQIASGANLICFTTGRGSVFGAKPVPSIKLATTSGLFRRMNEDMDINCGTILDGTETLPEVAMRIFETVIATASGKLTHSEELGFGEEEFQPWIMSAVL
jgi:altronate hydrolase